MRIVVIGILYIIYMLFRCPVWLAGADVPYIVRCLTYPFFHANIIHLAVNSLGAWAMWSDTYNKKGDIRNFLTAFVISAIVYPLGFRPCVGFSNILFAACGLRARPFSCDYWWKSPTTIVFLMTMVALCFVPGVAGTNHLAAFVLGVLFMNIYWRLIEPIIRDVRRFS